MRQRQFYVEITEATAIGTCSGCGQSIFDDEEWRNVDISGDVPDMVHAECSPEGS